MKKLTENLRQNWPTYFFEILVLIIGIYGAFALEEWKEIQSKGSFSRNPQSPQSWVSEQSESTGNKPLKPPLSF